MRKVEEWTEGEDGIENHKLQIFERGYEDYLAFHLKLDSNGNWETVEVRRFRKLENARTWANSRV